VLVDRHGVPRYWAAVWAAFLPGNLAPSTLSKYLGYVEDLYCYADRLLGDSRLDEALASIDVDLLSDTLDGYFQLLHNRNDMIEVSEARWRLAIRFITELLNRLATNTTSHTSIADLQSRLKRVDLLFAGLEVGRRRRSESVRSLPAEVIEALYEVVDPTSGSNPFRNAPMRWRVFTGYVLLLHQGLRRGELLSLPVDPVKSDFDKRVQRERSWLTVRYNPYEDDLRYSRPAIKTVDSVRQIPISDSVVTIIDEYAANYRGRPAHSFFLNSQKGRPLSTEALTKAFVKITSSLPKSALKVLYERTLTDSVSPHDLRHTCAVYRLKQFLEKVDMREAVQLMRAFFGWSRSSDMPLRYARAAIEDRLATVWRTEFDERVDVLRHL
jgi:integrase